MLQPRADVADIWMYTANTRGADSADQYTKAIERTLDDLLNGLAVARKADEIMPGLWRIRSGKHVCFFRKDGAAVVTVIRILHERMDSIAAFKKQD